MTQAVIFDVDGTLVDSVDLHARAWHEAFAQFGHKVCFENVRGQIGKGGDQLLPVFLNKEERESEGEAIEHFRGELFKSKYLQQVKAFPRVRELFERIRSDGKKIAIASSAKSDELDTYKRIAGIEDLVDAETSSQDAEKSKPYPDIFLAALDRLGDIPRSSILVVGDAPYDAEAAGKASIRAIGMLSGGFPEQILRAAGCIALYKDPADLLHSYEASLLSR